VGGQQRQGPAGALVLQRQRALAQGALEHLLGLGPNLAGPARTGFLLYEGREFAAPAGLLVGRTPAVDADRGWRGPSGPPRQSNGPRPARAGPGGGERVARGGHDLRLSGAAAGRRG
jgi:hypothetical protein